MAIEDEVHALSQEVAELGGVHKGCRGAIQRAILRLRDGLQQFAPCAGP